MTLKEIRKSADLTQIEVAEKLAKALKREVQQMHISLWEHGREPGIDVVRALAIVYNVDDKVIIDAILNGKRGKHVRKNRQRVNCGA